MHFLNNNLRGKWINDYSILNLNWCSLHICYDEKRKFSFWINNGIVCIGNHKYPWFDEKSYEKDELLSTK